MADKDQIVFELFLAAYKAKRELLEAQLKELDAWFDEQYYLLVEPSNSPL